MRGRPPADVRVLVVGATGYIGKFVVKELVKRGYQVVAFARERSGIGGKASADDTRKVRDRHLVRTWLTSGRKAACRSAPLQIRARRLATLQPVHN